jgi:antirestriction protein ArdC
MSKQQELRESITNQIIAAIEGGSLPWRRPWSISANAGAPCNASSRRLYRGVNPMVLQLSADRQGFRSRFWATFRQWQSIGCSVMKGQKGTQITFSTPITKTTIDRKGDEQEEKFWILRAFTVFNAEQCAGAERFHVGDEPVSNDELDHRFDEAQRVVEATEAKICHGGDRAFYVPETDTIHMPNRTQFKEADYFDTLFHELGHWTEQSARLNWDRSRAGNTYAAGELRAELAAVYLSNQLGLPSEHLVSNHAAYLQHWLEQMRENPSFIFRVSAQASKATDYIMSFSRKPEPVEEEAVA